jgi:hypothetical protein
VVTSYRYRGTLLYKTGLAPGNPEFDKLLKLYEETSRATPLAMGQVLDRNLTHKFGGSGK